MTDTLPETENWVRMSGVNRRAALAGSAAALGYALAAQPVSAATAKTPSEGLVEGMLTFPTGDIAMNAYRARPAGRKNAPVVLVVQEIFGIHEWIRDTTRRFAHAGYYAIAPDMFQRQGDPTKAPDIKTLFETIVSKVPDAQVMADLDRAAAFAGTDGGNAKKLGITGFCWGGSSTNALAASLGADVQAAVPYYGAAAATDTVPNIRAALLIHFAENDAGINAQWPGYEAALKAAAKTYEAFTYPGTQHGFHNNSTPRYHAPSEKLSWDRTIAHFKKYLA